MKRLIALLLQSVHLLTMVLCALLLIGSTKLMMLRRIPTNASFWDLSHVWLGWLVALLSLLFLGKLCVHGRWRLYFPWLALQWRPIVNDIKGLGKGKIPSAGGAGLFSLIEGFTVLSLVATAATGVMWFFTQGSADAASWRLWHHSASHWFIGLLIVHVLCALSHLIDMVRD
ncbi:cytochrome b/b6 domain-containing protein [Shewanella sp. C32]|uniref:Cytochrome b/b6 domain-containing protein n=1 Tax=Shewanella electrica TaxID=515560 RepID=A0ABT2FKR1_9GAMM|nr:cytochrome b/b6 domain-containing protein [Shewanella electrica]MCH1923908.1 cytochrome b/b6 domain-containing protein [Shewanella electrica]MCS4555811.1 cytochrome b/b6 domain-containing protein [Shewanella electrica]